MEPTGPDAVPLQAPEPPGEGIELRQRRQIQKTRSTDSNANNPQPTQKKRRLKWISKPYEMPSSAQTRTFMYMQLRKMRRRVQGRKAKSTIANELCCLCILIFVMIALAGWKVVELVELESTAPTASPVENLAPSAAPADEGGIVALLGTIVWILAAFVIISKSPFSPWMRMLKWMLLYIPLVWLIAEWSWTDDLLTTHHPWIYWPFIAAEILTFCIFVGFYWVYPLCLKSRRYGFVGESTKHKSAARFWGVNLVEDWTMTYTSFLMSSQSIQKCKSTHFCKYEGDLDEATGLPQGVGRWLDDSWEGETITGYWKQGEPVAPFSSWSYGTDDAVAAVRVAYFIATDDPFGKNDPKARNDQSVPTCGVASVECSVSGSFYNHLPEATLIEGPYYSDKSDFPWCYKNAIKQCIEDLDPIGLEELLGDKGLPTIEIRAEDTRGIEVVGHVYEPTGKNFDANCESLVVQVTRSDDPGGPVIMQSASETSSHNSIGAGRNRYEMFTKQPTMRFSRNMMHLPRENLSKRPSFFGGHVILADIEESGDENNSSNSNHNADPEKGNSNNEKDDDQKNLLEFHISKPPPPNANNKVTTLQVKDWAPAEHKDAVIFLAGYNSCTRDRLENFGQFLAMSKLSSKVYPFVFCWPGGIGPGYFQASQTAGNDKNFDNFHKLVASIRAAGIHNVHLMTHSMGAQCLLGAFQDRYDENGNLLGRSKISECFQLDPDFHNHKERGSFNSDDALICKTITMLNPDFPLEAFVDRGFLTLRRVCRTVTVVGDRNDSALWWSSLLNGVAERKGYDHRPALRCTMPPPEKPRSFRLQDRIGRSIESLHFPKNDKGEKTVQDKRLIYEELFSHLVNGSEEDPESLHWLDMDVIDMTGLDTNIAGMRHTGFSLNGMLLKDLEELIMTGKRAMKRSTLVYRDGNMFSYAHAPSFVSL